MNIRSAVKQTDDPDLPKNEQWELQKNDGGPIDVYSTAWNQIIAEVTPWGFVNLYIPKEEFLALPATIAELGERDNCFENWMIWGILKTKFVGFWEYEL